MATFECKVYELTIEEHPNADAIELARVGDYLCIVGKGQFQTGDLGVYIPEAAIVPEWLLEEIGLVGKLAGKAKNRVKAMKLRGTISQGLIYPVVCVPEKALSNAIKVIGEDGVEHHHVVFEGQDVTDLLNIEKYEPPIPSSMSGEVFNAFGKTISFDIENLKKHPDIFENGEEVVVSEKLHGCADYDTIIETLEYGQMKIGEIVEGEIKCHVKSYDISTNEIQFNEIIGYSAQDTIDDWYELETEDGQILKLTGNHLIWLPELRCYRAVEDLNGDEMLLFD